jgi:hypothetical protein
MPTSRGSEKTGKAKENKHIDAHPTTNEEREKWVITYEKLRLSEAKERRRVAREKKSLQRSRERRHERMRQRIQEGRVREVGLGPDDILLHVKLVGELGNGRSMTNVWLLHHKSASNLFVLKFFSSPFPYFLDGLESELYYYKIIDKIMRETKAPFFVELCGVYYNLGYDTIEHLFLTAFAQDEDFRLARSLEYAMCYDCHVGGNGDREPLLAHGKEAETGCTHGLQDRLGSVTDMLYCGVLTRFEPGYDEFDNTKLTLADFLLDDAITRDDKLSILLQFAWGLFVMHENNMVHNDPHEGNVFIRKYPTRKQIHYHMPSAKKPPSTFYTDTTYCVKIFDYDFADTTQRRNTGLTEYPQLDCTLDERRDLVHLNRILSAYMNINVDPTIHETVVFENPISGSLRYHTQIPKSRRAMLSHIYSNMSTCPNPQESDCIELSLRNKHYHRGACRTLRR